MKLTTLQEAEHCHSKVYFTTVLKKYDSYYPSFGDIWDAIDDDKAPIEELTIKDDMVCQIEIGEQLSQEQLKSIIA